MLGKKVGNAMGKNEAAFFVKKKGSGAFARADQEPLARIAIVAGRMGKKSPA